MTFVCHTCLCSLFRKQNLCDEPLETVTLRPGRGKEDPDYCLPGYVEYTECLISPRTDSNQASFSRGFFSVRLMLVCCGEFTISKSIKGQSRILWIGECKTPKLMPNANLRRSQPRRMLLIPQRTKYGGLFVGSHQVKVRILTPSRPRDI